MGKGNQQSLNQLPKHVPGIQDQLGIGQLGYTKGLGIGAHA